MREMLRDARLTLKRAKGSTAFEKILAGVVLVTLPIAYLVRRRKTERIKEFHLPAPKQSSNKRKE